MTEPDTNGNPEATVKRQRRYPSRYPVSVTRKLVEATGQIGLKQSDIVKQCGRSSGCVSRWFVKKPQLKAEDAKKWAELVEISLDPPPLLDPISGTPRLSYEEKFILDVSREIGFAEAKRRLLNSR